MYKLFNVVVPFLLNVGVIVKAFGTGDKFRLVGFLMPIGIFNLNDDFRLKAGYIALVSKGRLLNPVFTYRRNAGQRRFLPIFDFNPYIRIKIFVRSPCLRETLILLWNILDPKHILKFTDIPYDLGA